MDLDLPPALIALMDYFEYRARIGTVAICLQFYLRGVFEGNPHDKELIALGVFSKEELNQALKLMIRSGFVVVRELHSVDSFEYREELVRQRLFARSELDRIVYGRIFACHLFVYAGMWPGMHAPMCLWNLRDFSEDVDDAKSRISRPDEFDRVAELVHRNRANMLPPVHRVAAAEKNIFVS
jgi:hypothetical protein